MHEVWQMSTDEAYSDDKSGSDEDKTLTVGIGRGSDKEDDIFVFNGDKNMSELANDALMKWVATFLLRAPTIG